MLSQQLSKTNIKNTYEFIRIFKSCEGIGVKTYNFYQFRFFTILIFYKNYAKLLILNHRRNFNRK